MQGAQKLRSEAHLQVRRNDEVEAQRSRWTFYETINICSQTTSQLNPEPSEEQDDKVGSSEEAPEKPLRGLEYPLGGFFVSKYFLFSAIDLSFRNSLFLKYIWPRWKGWAHLQPIF
jgi:hypothetical protein